MDLEHALIPHNATTPFLYSRFVHLRDDVGITVRLRNYLAGLRYMPNVHEMARTVRGLARRHETVQVVSGFDYRSSDHLVKQFLRVELLVDGDETTITLEDD